MENNLQINGEEISEDEINSWLNNLDSEEKEEPKYVTKQDLDSALTSLVNKMTENIAGKSKDRYEYDEDDNDNNNNKKLSLAEVEKMMKNRDKELKQEFLNIVKTDTTENKALSFEEKVQTKYPDFKVDMLHLELDIRQGRSLEQSLEKQLKQEQARILRYAKGIKSGIYKVDSPDPEPTETNLKEGMPIELKDFNPTLHKDRHSFAKAYPNRKSRDEYFKKLEIYEQHK